MPILAINERSASLKWVKRHNGLLILRVRGDVASIILQDAIMSKIVIVFHTHHLNPTSVCVHCTNTTGRLRNALGNLIPSRPVADHRQSYISRESQFLHIYRSDGDAYEHALTMYDSVRDIPYMQRAVVAMSLSNAPMNTYASSQLTSNMPSYSSPVPRQVNRVEAMREEVESSFEQMRRYNQSVARGLSWRTANRIDYSAAIPPSAAAFGSALNSVTYPRMPLPAPPEPERSEE